MADTFNVTGSFDKPSYNKGDTMTYTITGGATSQTVTQQAISGSVALVASDGATETIQFPSGVNVNVTTTNNLTVKMSAAPTDPSRTWTLAANGLSATAIA